jgi:hypothetical protein
MAGRSGGPPFYFPAVLSPFHLPRHQKILRLEQLHIPDIKIRGLRIKWRVVMQNRKQLGGSLLAVLLLAAVPVVAQDVPRGTDAWRTPGDGRTSTDLNLPAGFLDQGCPGYADKVVLAGVPVATSPADAYEGADTFIERLQDVTFDAKGVGTTRIVVRGLHFRATADLKTGCGDWSAEVGLASAQTPTTMTIVRDGEAGGYFTAPISVDAVWIFRRASDNAERTLSTSNLLTTDERTPWTSATCGKSLGSAKALAAASSILVDSNNDGRPDAKIAGGSARFNAGLDPACRPWSPCRQKGLDPTRHCYEPISFNAAVFSN